MKTRRHHNNTGYRQIKRGKTREFVKHLKEKLKKEQARLAQLAEAARLERVGSQFESVDGHPCEI